jgi:hypothetical protein
MDFDKGQGRSKVAAEEAESGKKRMKAVGLRSQGRLQRSPLSPPQRRRSSS